MNSFTLLPEERRHNILKLIETNGSATVDDLAQAYSVSEMTIRRDLRILEREGLLRRVHGGAISSRGRSYEPPFLLRIEEQIDAKCMIGRRAAEMIADGDSIIIDVGSTTLEIARHLGGKQNLTIITPSLHVAHVLAGQPGIRLILTGGIVRPGELSLVGHLAERVFSEFYVDKLLLGIGCISFESGLTEFNLEDALVKQAMLRCAKECVLVADSTKFGRVALAAVAPLEAVHKIVTDRTLDAERQRRLVDQGIEVILA
jgi:DeoR/GlpR family transcriptional regulator of sugar metabolism